MLAYNPFYLFDVSFQLSFAAVSSILAFYPLCVRLLTVKNRLLRYLWTLLCVSFRPNWELFLLYWFISVRFRRIFCWLIWSFLHWPCVSFTCIGSLVFFFCSSFGKWPGAIAEHSYFWIESMYVDCTTNVWFTDYIHLFVCIPGFLADRGVGLCLSMLACWSRKKGIRLVPVVAGLSVLCISLLGKAAATYTDLFVLFPFGGLYQSGAGCVDPYF